MSTAAVTTEPRPALDMYRRPVAFGRLLRVQFDIWRKQRGLLIGTVLTLVIGLAATLFAVDTTGTVTATAVAARFAGVAQTYAALWLAVGALAGAAPFRHRWAALVLVVAPRRLRWLTACFGSTLGWAFTAAAGFGLLSWALTVGLLAAHGKSVAAATGVLTELPQLAAGLAINVAAGFFLGAAARGITAALILGYVVQPAVPFIPAKPVDVGRWIDLGAAVQVVAGGHRPPHGALPVITALGVWVVSPALLAGFRLRRSPVR